MTMRNLSTPDGRRLHVRTYDTSVYGFFEEHFGYLDLLEPTKEEVVLAYSFTKPWFDLDAVAELGVKERLVVPKTHLLWMLAQQPAGESDGPLLVNGYGNILYFANYAGATMAVSATWDTGPQRTPAGPDFPYWALSIQELSSRELRPAAGPPAWSSENRLHYHQ